MFGKLFAQTYRGSMLGAGLPVMALWPYMIANADQKGEVEINAFGVSKVLGTTPEVVEEALAFLKAPDPHSRTKAHEGARIKETGPDHYVILNYAKYRSIRSEEDRRAQLSAAQRRFRAKKKAERVISNPDVSLGVIKDGDVSRAVIESADVSPRQKTEDRGQKTEERLLTAQAPHTRIFTEEGNRAGRVVFIEKPDAIQLASALKACGSEDRFREVCALWFRSDDEWISEKWGYAGRFIGKKLQALLNNGREGRMKVQTSPEEEARAAAEWAERKEYARKIRESIGKPANA